MQPRLASNLLLAEADLELLVLFYLHLPRAGFRAGHRHSLLRWFEFEISVGLWLVAETSVPETLGIVYGDQAVGATLLFLSSLPCRSRLDHGDSIPESPEGLVTWYILGISDWSPFRQTFHLWQWLRVE